MSKLIVFEGISGSGKTTCIEYLKAFLNEKSEVNDSCWFSLERFREIALDIHNYTDMTPNTYSLIYALEFYAREQIYKSKKSDFIFLHRYIYTPLTHDLVRGTSIQLLEKLYNKAEEPDIIFFFCVTPQQAYDRIIKYRKPTFFECGLDVVFRDNLNNGWEKYINEDKSSPFLYESFINFQEKVYEEYLKIFNSKNNVVYIDSAFSIEQVIKKIQKIILSLEE